MLYHITPATNLPNILKDGLIPKIGPRALAGGEERASIWLLSCQEDANDAIKIWFFLECGQPSDLRILEVEIPQGADCCIRPQGFESVCYTPIPASCLRVQP